MKRLNKFPIGLISGLVAPALVIAVVLLGGDFEGSFLEVLNYTYEVGYLNVLLRPALLANLAIFIFFFNMRLMKICRGLIIATLIYGVFLLLHTYVF